MTKATDPIGGNRYGNMAPQWMVLDKRWSDGSCYYDPIDTNSAVTGVIVIDHKPWGGPWGPVDDREIVYDWPDPDYEQSPDGMWHDWVPGETTVMLWDLTDILLEPGNENLTDIRVRITDNTVDKRKIEDVLPGEWIAYDGNWIRSDNVLEQLCTRQGAASRKAAQLWCTFYLQVEPGIPAEDQNDPDLYWIDGPAIPITGTHAQPANPPVVGDCFNEWDLYTLQHAWLPFDYSQSPYGVCDMGSFIPNLSDLKVGMIRLRLCLEQLIENYCCIHSIRIYAVGPDDQVYGIYPNPADPEELATNYNNEFCGDDCLDPVIEWDISDKPCGEYTIYAEGYDYTNTYWHLFCRVPLVTAQSTTLKLDKVKKSDLVRIAPIYQGDAYHLTSSIKRNGYRPRNNHETALNGRAANATVDCTNYVTQLLRKLARLDHDTHIDPATGDYPIDHSRASWWNDDREDEVIHLEDWQWGWMEPGDIVARDRSPTGSSDHVMVFVELDDLLPDDFVGPLPPDYYDYEYDIWESTSDDDAGVRFHTRTGDSRTHFRQWIDNVVFTNCD